MNPNDEMRAYLNNDMDITKMSYAAIDNIRTIQQPLAPSSFIIKNDGGVLGDTTLPKSVEKIVMSDGAIVVTAKGITLTIGDNEQEDSEDFLDDRRRLIDERDALKEDKESLAADNLTLRGELDYERTLRMADNSKLEGLHYTCQEKDLTIKRLLGEIDDLKATVGYLESKIENAVKNIAKELGVKHDKPN